MDANIQCQIDWSATGEMLQGIGAILSTIFIFIGAILGANTFKNWRKQKLAERKIDYAERILITAYKAKRELSYVRNPFMFGHELSNAEQKLRDNKDWEKIATDMTEKYKTLSAIYNRLDLALNTRRELEANYPIARALFGEKLDLALQELNQQFHLVKTYADAQLRDTGADAEFTKKIEMHLWEGFPSEEEDSVTKTVKSKINEIEEICLPVIRDEA